jgi:cation diffusion facilitator family transporter
LLRLVRDFSAIRIADTLGMMDDDDSQSDHVRDMRWGSFWHRLADLKPHRHEQHHGHALADFGSEGIRATKVGLVGLGVTAALQALIVVVSGSVALLSDTIHNLGDALTSIPLWIAFALGRRGPTRIYTYGLQRAEDLAGLLIVFAIGASAVLVGLESVQRLFESRLINQIPWVIAAGVVGAAGNEWVARYRIRVGDRIGSEALIADGRHARSDAWTSLAVVAAGIGAAFGIPWVDPVAGLVVAAVIAGLLIPSVRGIVRRLLDGVDPELVAAAEAVIRSVPGVREVTELHLRHQGHQLHLSTCVAVDPDLSLAAGHEAAHAVEHALHHALGVPLTATVHVEPYGADEPHDRVAHHR